MIGGMDYLPLVFCVALPVLLVVLLRTSGAIMFFCVAASVLLQQFLDPEAALLANSLIPGSGIDYVSLGVFVVPLALAAAVFAGTVKKSMLALHILLAVLSGLAAVLASDRFLPGSMVSAFATTEASDLIRNYQTVIIASGMLLSIFVLRPPKHHDKHKKH
ncbi:MAG: hypothetical protein M3Q70_00575 [bacterium]|nr:hypothetical protein [bacterium]